MDRRRKGKKTEKGKNEKMKIGRNREERENGK